MCCGYWCLPLGCIKIPTTIENPEGYPAPPEKMLCSRCGFIGSAVYRQDKAYCGILFIPCIPCGRGDPFLACSRCNFPCGNINPETCKSCKVSTCFSVDYCPNCGTSRPGVPPNPKALKESEIPVYQDRKEEFNKKKDEDKKDGGKTEDKKDEDKKEDKKEDEDKKKTIKEMRENK